LLADLQQLRKDSTMPEKTTAVASESTPATAQRHCFLLRVRPDRVAEYVADHEHVWPEMQEALRRSGWGDYSLFLDRSTGLVVGIVTSDDFDEAKRRMNAEDINARWQESMAAYFLPVDDRVAPGAMLQLEQYFHLA
jgi:L-rhamnose mutarotase